MKMKEKAASLINRLKPTKRKVLVLMAVLAISGLMVGFMQMGQGGNSRQSGDGIRTITLTRGDLSSSVSATGTIYSAETTDVYSSLSYQVKAIHVAVGDKVETGDILAELNAEPLETDIAQRQASMASSEAKAEQNLSKAQQDLASFKNNVANDYDTTVYNARLAVTTAERDIELKNLDIQSANLEEQSQAAKVRTARRNLQDARNGEGKYEEYGEASDGEITELRNLLADAERALEARQINLEKAEMALEASKENLEKAKVALTAAEESVNNQITNLQNGIKTAQLNNDFEDQHIALEKLLSDIDKCVITAPVSGTVTAVRAVVGGSGSGLLFVIQDTDHLKVVTNIKEYDIGTVRIGNQVIIRADATGSTEFSGTLDKIAPTSTLTTTGASTASTEAEFESEITVKPGAAGLRVGMNARLSIITDERKDIFSVPYEAVGTDTDGNTFIFIMDADENGRVSYEKVYVQTGLETNLYMEIYGDGLREGAQVVRSAQSIDGETGLPAARPGGNGFNMNMGGDPNIRF